MPEVGKTDYAWRDAAACAQKDSRIFFPTQGQSAAPAKKICAACPVRAICLRSALEVSSYDDTNGVFGGTTPPQRRALRAAGLRTPKTHCKRDHEYTPENTRTGKNGERVCRTCDRIRNKRRRRAA